MLVPDSEASKKVEKQYQALVEMGEPGRGTDGELKTELLALHTVFGPAETLQQSRTELQTHLETDVRGGNASVSGDVTADGWPKGLSARQKAHYETQILKGITTKDKIVKLHARVAKRRTA